MHPSGAPHRAGGSTGDDVGSPAGPGVPGVRDARAPLVGGAGPPSLREQVEDLRGRLIAAEGRHHAAIAAAAPAHRASARNLVHYAALRSSDLTDLQQRLTEAGLSSLGRCEAAVLGSVEAVLDVLLRLDGDGWRAGDPRTELTPGVARALQAARTRTILAAPPERRRAEIMVTMPANAATDAGLVGAMVAAGMDCARINCAHDGPEAWAAMIGKVRDAARAADRNVRIHMDLGGPKIRTGAVPLGGVRLRRGDMMLLTAGLGPDRPVTRGADGRLRHPPRIGCTIPAALARVETGQSIWLDDGRVAGVVTDTGRDGLEVVVTRVPPGGHRLRANKGVNLPDTDLGVPMMTPADRRALPFIARNADMVGLSFVQRPEDVLELRADLDRLGGHDVATVLKVETRRAVQSLPEILLAAMRGPALGVMIARGDLAVECGWERLAEVQEDILSLSAAVHAPVIWATQVLEGLARTGVPSRAEISDVALAERAECVMLNKGSNVIEAMRLLDGILERMQHRQSQRRALLPRSAPLARFAEGG
jgi:pyruvate kinase